MDQVTYFLKTIGVPNVADLINQDPDKDIFQMIQAHLEDLSPYLKRADLAQLMDASCLFAPWKQQFLALLIHHLGSDGPLHSRDQIEELKQETPYQSLPWVDGSDWTLFLQCLQKLVPDLNPRLPHHLAFKHPLVKISSQFLELEQATPQRDLILDLFQQLIELTQQQANLNPFRLKRFRQALSSLRNYPEEIYSGAQVRHLPYVGAGTVRRINEIISTGTLEELEELKKEEASSPEAELKSLYKVGPELAKQWVQLGIRSIEDLRKMVQAGLKIPEEIKLGLQYHQDLQERIPRTEIDYFQKQISTCLPSHLIYTIAGSYRRGRASSGDIDLLVYDPQNKTTLEQIEQYLLTCDLTLIKLSSGQDKYTGLVRVYPQGKMRHLDIVLTSSTNHPAAILYFTGSKHFNIMMRSLANQRGYTLNEKGLFYFKKTGKGKGRRGSQIPVILERDIFDIIGLAYIPPEERELS